MKWRGALWRQLQRDEDQEKVPFVSCGTLRRRRNADPCEGAAEFSRESQGPGNSKVRWKDSLGEEEGTGEEGYRCS